MQQAIENTQETALEEEIRAAGYGVQADWRNEECQWYAVEYSHGVSLGPWPVKGLPPVARRITRSFGSRQAALLAIKAIIDDRKAEERRAETKATTEREAEAEHKRSVAQNQFKDRMRAARLPSHLPGTDLESIVPADEAEEQLLWQARISAGVGMSSRENFVLCGRKEFVEGVAAGLVAALALAERSCRWTTALDVYRRRFQPQTAAEVRGAEIIVLDLSELLDPGKELISAVMAEEVVKLITERRTGNSPMVIVAAGTPAQVKEVLGIEP